MNNGERSYGRECGRLSSVYLSHTEGNRLSDWPLQAFGSNRRG